MGCVAATAKRRRRQAKMGWKNLPPMSRPRYSTHTGEVWDRRAQAARERQQQMATRKARKKL